MISAVFDSDTLEVLHSNRPDRIRLTGFNIILGPRVSRASPE
jgi:hypothetical protein